MVVTSWAEEYTVAFHSPETLQLRMILPAHALPCPSPAGLLNPDSSSTFDITRSLESSGICTR